jgi:hypothetical protein
MAQIKIIDKELPEVQAIRTTAARLQHKLLASLTREDPE